MMQFKHHSILIGLAAFACLNSAVALSESEISSIQFMKQEEKLAHDVYTQLGERYDLAVFTNIARSEAKHMEAVDYLMQTFSIADSTPTESGVFSIPELSELYAQLIQKGEMSLIDALEVGVWIEQVDIEDLQAAIAAATDPTVLTVYKNLLRASQNHLRAFEANLASGGEAPAIPQLRMRGNGNGTHTLGANVEPNANAKGVGTLQFQSRAAHSRGPWTSVQGNGPHNTTNAKAGSVNQEQAVANPGTPMRYRVRNQVDQQASYSPELCSELAETPWPNGESIRGAWYATWMGELFIRDYPQVYSERHGWIEIVSFTNGELWFKDANGHSWMTTEAKYPWVYDPETDTWG